MLLNLEIKNFAIIDHLQVSFDQGLHVITGETGAGKSIMLDALGLALGERVKPNSKGSSESKTVVEAHFDISDLDLRSEFEEEELDYHDVAILRREINAQGRSRAFVNDSPVQISFLQSLAGKLIEVHQQFDQLALRASSFQYDVLDVLAKQKKEVIAFKQAFQEWRDSQKQLEIKTEEARKLQAEQDFLQFQLDELIDFDLDPEEDDQLSDLQTVLSQAQEIQGELQKAEQIMMGMDGSVLDQLQSIRQSLSNFSSIKKIQDLVDRLESVHTELDDWSQTLSSIHADIEHDPQRLMEVEDRLSTLFRLKKKHQVDTAADLLEVQNRIDDQLQRITSSEQDLEDLRKKIISQEEALKAKAVAISNGRKKIIPGFEKNVQAHLKGLGMPDAVIQVSLSPKDLHENGIDQVEFLFSSNKGQTPSPIKLTASGGEISRLNLAIKSEVAGEMALPTIIFDEIDAGVSGEVARKIGNLLEKLSSKHQIICITHTPQIASCKATHLHVYKDNSGDRTFTQITILEHDQRLEKIAEILDGTPPSQEALKNAQKLLER
jgi:DNA repair protein RecN (Recombination protein N)